MFHLFTLLLTVFVIIRFIWPLKLHRAVNSFVCTILLICSQHHLLWRLAFGSMFSPEVPRPLIIFVNIIYPAILILAVFQLVLEVVLLTLMLVKKRKVLLFPWVRYALAGLILMATSYGVSQAIRVPEVKNVEIKIKDLPSEFEGYRIIQLTDLHISRLFEKTWVEAVVKKTNELNADLIVITGDLIDGTSDKRQFDIDPLKFLKSNDGVFVIPGNHEYYFGYDDYMKKYQELGMRRLENSHAVLTKGAGQLVIAGVTDLSASRHNFPPPDEVQAVKDAPVDAPIIMLNHQPREAAKSAAVSADLQLSGHTHGGMIKGFDLLVAKFNNGYASGLYQVGEMQLYLNNGTALWPGFAVRIGVPSELTVITLKRK